MPKSHSELQPKKEVLVTVNWVPQRKGEEERLAFLINGCLKDQALLKEKEEELKEENMWNKIPLRPS